MSRGVVMGQIDAIETALAKRKNLKAGTLVITISVGVGETVSRNLPCSSILDRRINPLPKS
jgi:hypothetical protein